MCDFQSNLDNLRETVDSISPHFICLHNMIISEFMSGLKKSLKQIGIDIGPLELLLNLSWIRKYQNALFFFSSHIGTQPTLFVKPTESWFRCVI